jgi:hypothetical protein
MTMTYANILYLVKERHVTIPKQFLDDETAQLKLITEVVPATRILARPLAADHAELDPEKISQERIRKYIFNNYAFDVIDVSYLVERLVAMFKE